MRIQPKKYMYKYTPTQQQRPCCTIIIISAVAAVAAATGHRSNQSCQLVAIIAQVNGAAFMCPAIAQAAARLRSAHIAPRPHPQHKTMLAVVHPLSGATSTSGRLFIGGRRMARCTKRLCVSTTQTSINPRARAQTGALTFCVFGGLWNAGTHLSRALVRPHVQ